MNVSELLFSSSLLLWASKAEASFCAVFCLGAFNFPLFEISLNNDLIFELMLISIIKTFLEFNTIIYMYPHSKVFKTVK